MNNKSKIVLLCLMFFAFTIYVGCSSESKTLKLTPSKLDFGTVNIGDTFSIDVVLKNKFGKPMIISNITISGTNNYVITSGGNLPINLANNAEHTLSIMFAPTAAGPIAGILTFVHDASTKAKEVDLEGNGLAVARIVLSDTTFKFDKKLINRTHTHDLDIENVGTADLVINNLSFTGLGATVYSISAGGPTPINITPGATKTISIAFEPVVIGNFDANLEIHHNAVNEGNPIVYIVEGIAIDVDPQITLSQASPWDFGSVATTLPATQICEIENTGIDPLTVTSATMTTGTVFTVDSLKDSNGNVINFPQLIAVGAKIILAIKFAPIANTVYDDTLTFVHDGTNEVTPWDISLDGEGRDEVSRTFSYTGSAQQWPVPAGVSSIVVDGFGAEGGNSSPSNLPYAAGKGGRVQATVAVTPGSTVHIYVGGKGGNGGASPGQGGWNGGANSNNYSSVYNGGGGGGASDLRSGGTALSDRIVTSGGGGGAGYDGGGNQGGNGGGLTGQAGSALNNSVGHARAGKGGTQSAGGAGGNFPGWGTGQPGTLGNGGVAGGGIGAGGGGGHYGGGGGVWAGGGGGSSFTAVGATGVAHTQGVRSGNGEIIIKY
ncbi:MAG: choice-of-anchor D domain-containing protein [Planctomycetes bacterium]|nr:choice-of-anchor D domain-containing protein [Planctomycetota bacterium]